MSERRRLTILNLDVKCLQLLRAMIHEEFARMPQNKKGGNKKIYHRALANARAVQNSLDQQGIPAATCMHVNRPNNTVVRECFTLLYWLYKNNTDTPSSFLDTKSDMFFEAVKRRLRYAAALVKEKRVLLLQNQRWHKDMGALLGQTTDLSMSSMSQDNKTGENERLYTANTVSVQLNEHAKRLNATRNYLLGKQVYRSDPEFESMVTGVAANTSPMGMEKNPMEIRRKMTKNKRNLPNLTIEDVRMLSGNNLSVLSNFEQDFVTAIMILRTISALCDLEFSPAQDLMREQTSSVKSINVVAELCHFLAELYSSVDSATVDLISDLLETIAECIQGNTKNQAVVFDGKIIDYINYLLQIDEITQLNDETTQSLTVFEMIVKVNRLRLAMGIVIKFLVEKNQGPPGSTFQSKVIMSAINEELLFEEAMRHENDIRMLALSSRNHTHNNEDFQMYREGEKVGFMYYHLLCRACDLGQFKMSKIEKTSLGPHFKSQSFSIEIISDDELQRIHFRLADQKALRSEVKERLVWEIDRSSHGNKMREFINWIEDIHDDMTYQRMVFASPIGRSLVQYWNIFNYISLAMTLSLNVIMIASWDEAHKRRAGIYHHDDIDTIWRLLGGIHNVASIALVFSYFLSNASGLMASVHHYGNKFTRMKESLHTWWLTIRCCCGHSKSNRANTQTGRSPGTRRKSVNRIKVDNEMAGENVNFNVKDENVKERKSHVRLSNLSVDIFGGVVQYYFIFLVFSFLGTIVSPAFFAFHLMQIVQNNQLLKRVIRAVTVNGRSLLWVCVLGVATIYGYAVVAFTSLRSIMHGNWHFCKSLWQCTLSMFREGLIYRTMRIDYPVKVYPSAVEVDAWDFSLYSWKLFFDLSFFVIVLTIGLNVIFGIIVDTFRQLRDNVWRTEQDMQTRCFICERKSYEFDQRAAGFRHHTEREHSTFAYVFFFIHLEDSNEDELGNLEKFILDMRRRKIYTFFPLNRAICLEEHNNENGSKTAVDNMQDQQNAILHRLVQLELAVKGVQVNLAQNQIALRQNEKDAWTRATRAPEEKWQKPSEKMRIFRAKPSSAQ